MKLYSWHYKDNSLFLELPEFTKENKDVMYSLLQKELTLRKISITAINLQEIFKGNGGITISLKNTNFDGDGKCLVKVDKDLLEATITIFPPINGRTLTVNDIKKSLAEHSVTYGVDDVKIMIALTKGLVVDEKVALGKPAQNGKDAEIKYHFNPKGLDIKPKELKDGSVDFYNVNLIQNVKKGQLLVEKIPATKGSAGVTVTGLEIPPVAGREKVIPAGKNLEVSADYLQAYAQCEGHVVFTAGKISVLPVYEVIGDVDLSTGNIEYSGNVIVRGNITTNFSIRCNGDVEIFGNIEGGHVYATGNIIVKKGIKGLSKSKIVSKGNIYAEFIEHAIIHSGGDVIVNEAIMHSQVESYHTIQVNGRKGLIVGGLCRAGKGIICKNMGSNLATLTKIEVGINPELRKEYNDLCKEQVLVKENIDKTIKALRILNDLKEQYKGLPPDKEALYVRLINTKNELLIGMEQSREKREALEEEIKSLDQGYVKVYGVLNSGINITIGKANKHISNEYFKVELVQSGLDIKILSLD